MRTYIQKTIHLLSEFSIPLLLGVVLALAAANIFGEDYTKLLHTAFLGDHVQFLGHPITFHFLINDIFMVFFFGIAAVEITQALRPGGSLNPVSRAINPLLGTIGGIVGPVGTYFLLCYMLDVEKEVYRGWGIPTATDIALAWLLARFVFGARHPAVAFLLLLAVVDDAIGLGIIAVFYPDPNHPVELPWLLLTLGGVLVAGCLRFWRVRNFWYYLILGGIPSWLGLLLAHLHPALALVVIVPFMPSDPSIKEKEATTLHDFEHFFKTPVDLGLFGFGLANAAVPLGSFSTLSWIVCFSLLGGKTLGITMFSYIGYLFGFALPKAMNLQSLILVSLIAGLGLTVALFVSGEAFTDPRLQEGAKMGALLSALVVVPALLGARLFRIKKIH